MTFTKDTAAELAISDLASRLGTAADRISVVRIADSEFANSALGAPVGGEMAAMMMSSGWVIELSAGLAKYEYRADKYQLRLYDFQGKNYVIR